MVKRWTRKIGLFVTTTLITLTMLQSVFAAYPYESICNSNEWEVLKLTNKERLKDGEEALSSFALLQSAADVRTKEIVSSFSHTRPNGTTCFTAITQKNITYYAAGENIATGQRSPAEVMNGWMNSSGHRANILSQNFQHVGVGYGDTGYYGTSWVQLFVGGCSVRELKVNGSTTAYPVGTSIDEMNRYLTVTCSYHGTSYVPIISQMCTGYDATKNSSQSVKVKFQGQVVDMPVIIGQAGNGANDNEDDTSEGVSAVATISVAKINETTYKLTWKRAACDGYEIWRASASNKKFAKIKTISKSSKTSYKDDVSDLKKGKKYLYKVRAFDKVGGKKKYSSFSKTKSIKIS